MERERSFPKSVLVLGSGALKIGEAGEFDYSGSQALKALREEGIRTVLINPNIATIQTSEGMADEVYLLPITPQFVEDVIKREKIDGILLSFGGQTALNCGLELYDSGVLSKYGVRVLGTPIEAIRDTEDRDLFKKRLGEIGVRVAKSRACRSPEEVREAAGDIGYPVMLRGAFALGGLGSAIVESESELNDIIGVIFSMVPQVLVEESLKGFKEIEYEVVIDRHGNGITVCNMENMDPIGIHTGESIVVAPSQTLNNYEYHMLREIALRTIRHLGIVGECNIQYALDPNSDDYRVIEVNARLSRSSALASKATGYPLAYVAAKLALGFSLTDLPNKITQKTKAFFEPALDYCVVKVPRWDLEKFAKVEKTIGSSMKSVGEVMAIGRDFLSALQKALRMIGVGVEGLEGETMEYVDFREAISNASPYRIFAIANAMRKGISIEQIHNWSKIDRWFLHQIERVVDYEEEMRSSNLEDEEFLFELKKAGFSDAQIARICGRDLEEVRSVRDRFGIYPVRRQIDTLAAEYSAETNYLYLSFDSKEDEVITSGKPRVLILGSGVYRIGSSVEFDWCCVNTIEEAKRLGYETILINNNPETVSTDFDVCDRLIFDEITLESVLDVIRLEKPEGVILSVGGQVPNNLAMSLAKRGIRIFGTQAEMIDVAEDRHKFSTLCDRLGIAQPVWTEFTGREDIDEIIEKIGFPLLIRPSYVLSGSAMRVVRNKENLTTYLERAALVSREYPVVISHYEVGAKEIEIDAVARDGEVLVWAISEHIENAGVHSGDATLILPPQRLYLETIRRIKIITRKLAKALNISGPFNIQFLARDNNIKVIECNLRASRSFPFVSKVTGLNYIKIATDVMLGHEIPEVENRALDMDYVAVKAAQFSFRRLAGADPVLGVEMASTGEVGCIGDDLNEALLKSMIATGFRVPERGVLLSIGPEKDKREMMEYVSMLREMGLSIFATEKTASLLRENGIDCKTAYKVSQNKTPTVIDIMKEGLVDMVVNIPSDYGIQEQVDGYRIRRSAIDYGISLITNQQLARALITAIVKYKNGDVHLKSRPLSTYR